MRLLHSGDVIYVISNNTIRARYTINSTTKTTALTEGLLTFNRDVNEDGQCFLRNNQKEFDISYYLETPELRDSYLKNQLIGNIQYKVCTINIDTFNLEQLAEIYKLINSFTKA